MQVTSNQLPFSLVSQKITDAKSILILLPQTLSFDSVASGLALYLTLKDQFTSEGESGNKHIQIVSSGDVTVAYQRLYGVGSISKQSGSKNLVITLNTAYDNIEKVSSDNDQGKFNLMVELKNGLEKITEKEVSFSYRGIDADLIIGIGLSNSQQAGDLLIQEPTLFADRESIVFSVNGQEPVLGSVKIYDPQSSSIAELLVKYLRFAKTRINPDIATNLLAGIEMASNNFSFKSTADTFSAVSWCMRIGGKRNHLSAPLPTAVNMQIPTQAIPTPFSQSVNQNQSLVMPFPEQTQSSVLNQTEINNQPAAPAQDWLEPKIFSGTSKV